MPHKPASKHSSCITSRWLWIQQSWLVFESSRHECLHCCFTVCNSCMDRSEYKLNLPCSHTSASTESDRASLLDGCLAAGYWYSWMRSLRTAVAKTWNSLPPEVTSSTTLSSLESQLEPYLFSLLFPGLWYNIIRTAVLWHYVCMYVCTWCTALKK